ncbi:MAG: sporulation protein YunB [Bacilli bacterium]|nr:sporulation protein YunB [Bacilli bacterium]
MRKRIHLRRKKVKKKKNILLITILFVFVAIYFVIDFVGGVFGNKLMDYAELEVGRIARYVVNYAVTTENIKQLDFNNLFIVQRNKNDEIQTVDFDPVVVNTVLNAITETVIKHFRAIEEGNLDIIDLSDSFLINTSVDKLKQGIIAEIPMGVITDNTLLSNLGPKIPVKLSIAGEVESQIGTEVEYYGINNALVTVYVNIDVSQRVYMPIATGRVVISQKIPIAIKMMQGVVPDCYFGGLNDSEIVNKLIK